MTTPPPPPNPNRKRRLGELLVEAGVVTDVQLKAALSEQRKWGGRLGRTLVEMGFVQEETMVLALARQLNLPTVDLDRITLPAEVVQWLRLDIAERYGVFPLGGDARQRLLQVATADPTNVEAMQELAFHTGMRIQAAVSGSTAIDRAIRHYYYGESVTSSPTATPEQLHMQEQSYELTPNITSVTQVLPRIDNDPPVPAADAPAQPVVVDLARKVDELSDRMAAMEKHAANQVRALRGLFELLLEKGLISREEYLAKIRGPQSNGR